MPNAGQPYYGFRIEKALKKGAVTLVLGATLLVKRLVVQQGSMGEL